MHQNTEDCAKCEELFNRYPNFDSELRTWFTAIRVDNPEAHISCAGRGKIDQEVCFQRGASKAHYGQSAHNFNCAIDIFQLKDGEAVWDQNWFYKVVAENLYSALKWYGIPGASFYELPHVEVADWKDRVKAASVSLVE